MNNWIVKKKKRRRRRRRGRRRRRRRYSNGFGCCSIGKEKEEKEIYKLAVIDGAGPD